MTTTSRPRHEAPLRRAARDRWPVVVVAVLATALAALAMSLLHDDVYVAEAQLLVSAERPSDVAAVLEGDRVYREVVAATTRGDVPAVEGVTVGGSQVVEVRVRAGRADTAARFANAYAQAYLAVAPRVAAEAGDAAPDVQLVRAATEPAERTEPRPVRTTLLAAIVGLLIGLLAAALLHRFDTGIRDGADLAAVDPRFPVLAELPDDPAGSRRPMAVRRGDDPTAVALRRLRDSLPAVRLGDEARVVLVTGLAPGHGASTVAAGLAAVTAEVERVVLVDADLGDPQLHRLLGVDGSRGLVDNLADEVLDMTVLPMAERFELLPAGRALTSVHALLGRVRMEQVMHELAERADRVVVDGASVSRGGATSLARTVDGIVVVVRAGTPVHRVADGLLSLDAVGPLPVLGLVLNRAGRR